MALARNIKAEPSKANEISISWDQPIGFNNSTDELIVTRTNSHFPIELYNSSYPTKATDSRPMEVYRASNILGSATSSSVGVLTDSTATFPTLIPLTGRLVRDANSKVYRILSNTATELTLDTTDTPSTGVYIVLSDFPQEIKNQQNFETDIRTEVGPGFIKNLIKLENGSLIPVSFVVDSLANLIHMDGSSTKRIIKSNTQDTIYFYANTTPVLGAQTSVLNSFNGTTVKPYIDSFLTEVEADSRSGSGLLDNIYYYYTIFTKPKNANVAQAQLGAIDSGTPTQAVAISVKDRKFGKKLYNRYWPSIHQQLDSTGDLEDLMEVFGFNFDESHALISAYRLQSPDYLYYTALPALSEQTGLPGIGFSIGSDTLRRISKDMIPCWKLKGSKEGIAIFIRKITTWDVTNGTADFSSAILDFLPNVSALRFFDPNLGSTNTRITTSEPAVVAGGRFARGLPGIVIPGFFTFREFVITLPEVALHIGFSESFSNAGGNTTMVDSTANFGTSNSLVGNFIIPNEAEVNDIFEVVSNTNTSITVKGVISNRNPGGKYVILSPLNNKRFLILNTLLPVYVPYGTKAGFTFV